MTCKQNSILIKKSITINSVQELGIVSKLTMGAAKYGLIENFRPASFRARTVELGKASELTLGYRNDSKVEGARPHHEWTGSSANF